MAVRKGHELNLEVAEAALDRALESEDPGPETKKEKILALGQKINTLKNVKKKTWAEITAMFEDAGGISKDTLRAAMRDYNKSEKAKSGANGVKPQVTPAVGAVSTPGKKAAGRGGHGSAHNIGD
jgi:hypothetical protein